MPRRARLTLPGVPMHIIQRGNNRQACFYCTQDYQFYLNWLLEYADQCECKVHAFVLMNNHVHILLTPESNTSAGALMKRLGQRYVQYINRTYQRSGTLWEGRFRSCLTQDEKYVLACYRYIELNPVRAGMVKHPAEYEWSSYRVNAQGDSSLLIDSHYTYNAMANNVSARQAAYRELFSGSIKNIDEFVQRLMVILCWEVIGLN